MNIVWLTPEVPYPPIGGRNGVFNRIIQLSKYNNIFLFSIAYNSSEKENTLEMKKYCKKVYFYNRSDNKLVTLIKSIFYPYSVASRFRKDICRDIEKTINEKNIDMIIVDFPNMAKNVEIIIKKHPNIKVTLNEHNVEFIRMRNMINVKTISLTKRFAYYLESFRLEHYEKTIYESGMFDSITFFSSDDMKFFETKWRKCNSDLKMFPLGANGFDVIKEMDTNHTLLFIGRLDAVAIPNVEAIKWFCDNVFADILRNVPDTKLIIAGANPDKEIYDYRNQNIEVIANFDNLLDVYNLSDCVILPLQSGGGVKGKLLEAAALKKIIITTDHGIEGTEFEDKKHVLLANSTREFAEKCVFAMLNKERCIPMINAAFSLFEQRYNWEKIGKMYNDYLNNRKV